VTYTRVIFPQALTVTLIGMAWLNRLSADSSYLTAIALPMVLIGAGQGATLSPLTAAGIAGVAPDDAGAASGLVNVAHQLGGSLGLGILVTVFAAADAGTLDARHLLAHRVATSLTAGTALLALALVLVVALIVRVRETANVADDAGYDGRSAAHPRELSALDTLKRQWARNRKADHAGSAHSATQT